MGVRLGRQRVCAPLLRKELQSLLQAARGGPAGCGGPAPGDGAEVTAGVLGAGRRGRAGGGRGGFPLLDAGTQLAGGRASSLAPARREHEGESQQRGESARPPAPGTGDRAKAARRPLPGCRASRDRSPSRLGAAANPGPASPSAPPTSLVPGGPVNGRGGPGVQEPGGLCLDVSQTKRRETEASVSEFFLGGWGGYVLVPPG